MQKIIPESFAVKKIISQYSPPGKKIENNIWQSSRHWHREILIPLHGSSRYMFNNHVYDCSPGVVCLIDCFVPHALGYTSEDKDLLHLWINFSGSVLRGFVCRVYDSGKIEKVRMVCFSGNLLEIVLQRWDQLVNIPDADDKTVADFMQKPLELIVNEFFLLNQYQKQNSESESISGFLKNYIRNCCGRGCSIAQLSAISGFSASHLSHSFYRETGMSIGEFIDIVRREYTVHALKRGMTQKEISYELGFSSPASFWSWLQKHKKMLENNAVCIKNKQKKQD